MDKKDYVIQCLQVQRNQALDALVLVNAELATLKAEKIEKTDA